MSESYFRHIIYRRWPGDTFRPHASFATLREAVRYVDDLEANRGTLNPDPSEYKVIDLEHIDFGDMLTAEECAETVARFRRETAA